MPFLPSDITNLVAWWDAATITSLNDGDPVSTWLDLSGNGHSWTQSGAARPTYKVGIQGSPAQPVVRFDGSTSWLSASIGNLAQPYTVVLLMAGRTFGAQFVAINGGTTTFIGAVYHDGTKWALYQQGPQLAYKTSVDTGFHTHIALMNDLTSYGRFDGVETDGALNGAAAQADPLHLGADYVPAQFAPIDVGVMLYYSRTLTGGELTSLETYLGSTPRATGAAPAIPGGQVIARVQGGSRVSVRPQSIVM